MALFAIGDPHLSLNSDKPMDFFGGRWENYVEKLTEGFSIVKPEDVTVICGDLSWGMSLEEAKADFLFLDSLPGKKIILKGNHDYWWSTVSRAETAFREWGIESISILNNNAFHVDGISVCGTRGWSYDSEHQTDHDRKIMARELLRMEASLRCAETEDIAVFLHYPPKLVSSEWSEMTALFAAYGVKSCWYGHLHGQGCYSAFIGTAENTAYHLVSADFVSFYPQKII